MWRLSQTTGTFDIGLKHFCIITWQQVYKGQGIQCGGLNEKCFCRIGHLNSWFPVGGAVWGGLVGVALLVEVCH